MENYRLCVIEGNRCQFSRWLCILAQSNESPRGFSEDCTGCFETSSAERRIIYFPCLSKENMYAHHVPFVLSLMSPPPHTHVCIQKLKFNERPAQLEPIQQKDAFLVSEQKDESGQRALPPDCHQLL